MGNGRLVNRNDTYMDTHMKLSELEALVEKAKENDMLALQQMLGFYHHHTDEIINLVKAAKESEEAWRLDQPDRFIAAINNQRNALAAFEEKK